MGRGPGTTLDNPVRADHQPDLRNSRQEIQEYFQQHNDIFEYLLKELLTAQPADPLEHMVRCLQTEYPSGPLKVVVCSAPGVGRAPFCKRLASHFGLEYIGAGDLLRDIAISTGEIDYAADELVGKLVMERVLNAAESMRGWVLDGFPRTRVQATYLKEQSIVPSHVLLLKAGPDWIREKNERVFREMTDNAVSREMLEAKLNIHQCNTSALETYVDRLFVIDLEAHEEERVWEEMERSVRTLPRSRKRQPPPRVILIGPPGVGVKEHASGLAARLGSIYLDDTNLLSRCPGKAGARAPLVGEEAFQAFSKRLRDPDCTQHGWVACGFPATTEFARLFQSTPQLTPMRVIVLDASLATCTGRLQRLFTDPLTGKTWTSMPTTETIRKRLVPCGAESAAVAEYEKLAAELPGFLEIVATKGADRILRVDADDTPRTVFHEVVEFAERPLPRPPRS